MTVSGTSPAAVKSTTAGTLNRASRSLQKAIERVRVRALAAGSVGTIQAQPTSPIRSCGMPTTCAAATPGKVLSTSSTSLGSTSSPPQR